jgi:hypothetical protein
MNSKLGSRRFQPALAGRDAADAVGSDRRRSTARVVKRQTGQVEQSAAVRKQAQSAEFDKMNVFGPYQLQPPFPAVRMFLGGSHTSL